MKLSSAELFRYKPNMERSDSLVTAPNCTSLTYLSHRGRAVASFTRRLYLFSKRNCSFWDSFEKSGGQIFFGL